jgi:hypothetical protein
VPLSRKTACDARVTRGLQARCKCPLAPITPEEMQQHQIRFGSLCERWLSGDELGVHEQLDKLEVEELRRFADSNNLNITSKMSKERVLQLIGARFREKKQLHPVRTSRTEDS